MGAEGERTWILKIFIKASKKGVEAGGSREESRTKRELFLMVTTQASLYVDGIDVTGQGKMMLLEISK